MIVEAPFYPSDDSAARLRISDMNPSDFSLHRE